MMLINSVPGFWRLLAVMVYIITSSVLAYLVARVSWWAFEVHFINLKRYFPEGSR
jgi:predicted nucleic acid-binding protein